MIHKKKKLFKDLLKNFLRCFTLGKWINWSSWDMSENQNSVSTSFSISFSISFFLVNHAPGHRVRPPSRLQRLLPLRHLPRRRYLHDGWVDRWLHCAGLHIYSDCPATILFTCFTYTTSQNELWSRFGKGPCTNDVSVIFGIFDPPSPCQNL